MSINTESAHGLFIKRKILYDNQYSYFKKAMFKNTYENNKIYRGYCPVPEVGHAVGSEHEINRTNPLELITLTSLNPPFADYDDNSGIIIVLPLKSIVLSSIFLITFLYVIIITSSLLILIFFISSIKFFLMLL